MTLEQKLTQIYTILVKANVKTIDQVPENIKTQVQEALKG